MRAKSVFEIECDGCGTTVTSEVREFACSACGRLIVLHWGGVPIVRREDNYVVDLRREAKCQ